MSSFKGRSSAGASFVCSMSRICFFARRASSFSCALRASDQAALAFFFEQPNLVPIPAKALSAVALA